MHIMFCTAPLRWLDFSSHTLMFPSGDLNNKAKQNWAGEEASAPENSVFFFFFFSEFAENGCMHIAKSKNTPQTLNSLPALTH